MRNEIERCSGGCCKSFSLPQSPIELKFQLRVAKLARQRDLELMPLGPDYRVDEIEKINDMVIFIRADSNKQMARDKDRPRARVYRYTCKHFDTKTNNCMNYENRPRMCSDFPYGKENADGSCDYPGCTRRCDQVPEVNVEQTQVQHP